LQTAAQYGSVVGVFASSQRGVDLRCYFRHGPFAAHFNNTVHTGTGMLEPLPAAGEIITPGYIADRVLGFELRASTARDAKPNAGLTRFVLDHGSNALRTGFYSVPFLGARFIAVVVPPPGTVCIDAAGTRVGARPCSLGDEGDLPPLFALPVTLHDRFLPVSAVLFRATDRAEAEARCTDAAALMAAMHERVAANATRAPMDRRARETERRILGSADGMYALRWDAPWLCAAGEALRGDVGDQEDAMLLPLLATTEPEEPNATLVGAFCRADVPEDLIFASDDDAAALQLKLQADGTAVDVFSAPQGDTVLAALSRPVAHACRLICGALGFFVPASGEPEACARLATRLLASGTRMDNATSGWPRERLTEATGCDPAWSIPARTQSWGDVRLNEPTPAFAVVAVRASAAQSPDGSDGAAAETRQRLVDAWRRQYVRVIEIAVDDDDDDARVVRFPGGPVVAVSDARGVLPDAQADFTVVRCARMCAASAGADVAVYAAEARATATLLLPGSRGRWLPGSRGRWVRESTTAATWAAGALVFVWTMRQCRVALGRARPFKVKR